MVGLIDQNTFYFVFKRLGILYIFFAISSIIKQEQLSLTNKEGFIVGLFDAFKGMFGGKKTDAPVNIDTSNNVATGVSPMIPSSQPSPPSPETDKIEGAGINELAGDPSSSADQTTSNSTDGLNTQPSFDSPTTENLNNSSETPAEDTSAADSVATPDPNVMAQINSDPNSGSSFGSDASTDPLNSVPVDTDQAETTNEVAEDSSANLSSNNTDDLPMLPTQDSTVNPVVQSQDSPKEDTEQTKLEDNDSSSPS